MTYAAYKQYDHNEKRHRDIHFTIDTNGHWYFHGSQNPGPMKREALVRLFAAKALRQIDGAYYLKTPYESYRVEVEDVPFLITDYEVNDAGNIRLISNIGDSVVLNETEKIFLKKPYFSEEQLPYIEVGQGLHARLDRHVRAALIEKALGDNPDLKPGQPLMIESSGVSHPLAIWEETA